jgi:hypothetical protein
MAMAGIVPGIKPEARAAKELVREAKYANWIDALEGRPINEAAADIAHGGVPETAGGVGPPPGGAAPSGGVFSRGGAGGRSALLSEAQRAAEAASGRHAPLEGLPVKPVDLGEHGLYVPGPVGRVKDIAESYMRDPAIDGK